MIWGVRSMIWGVRSMIWGVRSMIWGVRSMIWGVPAAAFPRISQALGAGWPIKCDAWWFDGDTLMGHLDGDTLMGTP